MKNLSFSFVSDTIFLFLIGLFLSLPIFNGFLVKPYNVICSLFFGVMTCVIFYKISLNKKDKLFKTMSEKKLFDDALTQINFMSRNELFTFFKQYLQKKKIYFIETRLGFILPEKGFYMFFKFNYQSVEKLDIVRFYNALSDNQSALILSSEFSQELIAFAKRFNGRIKLCDFSELFCQLKEYNHLPPSKYYLLEENQRHKLKLSDVFYKKNAKNYLFFGIIFSIFTFFVPLKVYYVLCSAFFLVLALLSLVYGKTKNTSRF